MDDPSKANQELLEEKSALKQKIQELEKSEAECNCLKEALQDSEELHTKLIDTMPDIVIRMNLNGEILFVNDAGLRLGNYQITELIGQNMLSFIAPEDQDRAARNTALMFERRLGPQEYQLVTKDGTKLPVEVNGDILRNEDGSACGMLHICRDSTERKRAEEELRKSEEKFRELVEHINDVFYELDKDGIIQYASPSVERISGYCQSEVIGRSISNFLDPEYTVSAVENVQKALPGSNAPHEYRIRRKSGDICWIRISSSPVRRGDQVVGIRGVMSDITERKRAEQEMAILAGIGRLISSTLEIEEVYERFAIEVRNLIRCDRISIDLNNPAEATFTIAYVSGFDIPGRRPGDTVPLKGSITEIILRTRTGLLINQASLEEITKRFPGATNLTTVRAGMRSVISIPLISRDEVIGTLHLRAKKANAYTEQDLHLAEKIGMQIAGAIANAQLFRERQNAEKLLRESEMRFRAIFEQAAVGVAEIDIATGSFITVNRRLCELFGRTEEELLATNFLAITHPDDLRLHLKNMALMKAGKLKHFRLEKRYIRKDGVIIWATSAISMLRLPGEPLRHNSVVIQDITEHKRISTELERHSKRLAALHETGVELTAELKLNALLQSIVQHALDLIDGTYCICYLYRPETDLLERVAMAGEPMPLGSPFRQDREGFVGHVWSTRATFFLNDYRSWPGRKREYDSMPSRALLGTPIRWSNQFLGIVYVVGYLPHQYTQADAKVLEMFATQAAIAIRNAQLYDHMDREIAERKRAEKLLQESEQNFRTVVENANDGLIISLNTGTHIYANKCASEITGYSVEELLKIRMKELAHPDEIPKLSEILKKRMSGEEVPQQYETAIVHKEGKKVPIEVTGAKTLWHDQDADIVVFRDITERKKSEETQNEIREQLESRVRERTIELEETNTALRVLIKKGDMDQKNMEEILQSNVNQLVTPFLSKLRVSQSNKERLTYLNILEINLNHIVSPFINRLSAAYKNLTPKEIQIAEMVKQGKKSKEIAELFGISVGTVITHRNNIRKKLDLKSRDSNLRSHLLSLA